MKQIFIFILGLLTPLLAIGQNLVPNPSFELYSRCSTFGGHFYVIDWSVTNNCPGSSPDYFNICGSNIGDFGVPDNIVGTQVPQEGVAYAGIYCYGGREYIYSQLISPLTPNEKYELSFYVSLAEASIYGVNNVGASVTKTALECSGTVGVITVTPQVKEVIPITDYLGWTLISGTFTAEGGEEFITIGNFYSDDDTQKSPGNPGGNDPRSYYYIDSVSLTHVATAGIDIPDFKDVLNIYPNPFRERVTIEHKNGFPVESIGIYTIGGSLIKEIPFSQPKVEIQLGFLKAGIYIIMITDSNSQKHYKKVVKL